MHLPTKKEHFSLAYIAAVAARAGFQVVEPKADFDSIDGILLGDEGRRPRVEFQAKATTRDLMRSDHVAYPLPRKNYDDLRADAVVPRILIIVVLPEIEENWLAHSEDQLVLRKCGYWMSLAGLPDSENSDTVTVHVPRRNLLDPDQLGGIMVRMARGEPL